MNLPDPLLKPSRPVALCCQKLQNVCVTIRFIGRPEALVVLWEREKNISVSFFTTSWAMFALQDTVPEIESAMLQQQRRT